MGVDVYVALDEVEEEVEPEEHFDHVVEVHEELAVNDRESCVVHRGDTGVAHQEQHDDVENGLVLVVGGYNNSILPRPILLHHLLLHLDFVFFPILLLIAIKGLLKYTYMRPCPKQRSLPPPLRLVLMTSLLPTLSHATLLAHAIEVRGVVLGDTLLIGLLLLQLGGVGLCGHRGLLWSLGNLGGGEEEGGRARWSQVL